VEYHYSNLVELSLGSIMAVFHRVTTGGTVLVTCTKADWWDMSLWSTDGMSQGSTGSM
jgi:hypothetical protein